MFSKPNPDPDAVVKPWMVQEIDRPVKPRPARKTACRPVWAAKCNPLLHQIAGDVRNAELPLACWLGERTPAMASASGV